MKISVNKISPLDFLELENKIRESFTDIALRDEAKESLDDQFSVFSPVQDHQYFFTHFRLYSSLMWKNIYAMEINDVEQKLLKKCLLPGVLLGYEPLNLLKNYLKQYTFSQDHLKRTYSEFQKIVFESEEVVGEMDGKTYCIRDIIKELQNLNTDRKDSLDKTEKIAKIQKIIESNDKQLIEKIYTNDLSDVAFKFTELLNYFIKTTPETIEKNLEIVVLDTNIKPNKVVVQSNQLKPTSPSEVKKEQPMNIINKITNPRVSDGSRADSSRDATAPQAFLKPALSRKINQSEPATKKKLSYGEIRKKIESFFAKDKIGNFADITAVLGELQKISSEQGDPRIKDLYFFNEQSGNFEWNENLFNE